MSIARTVQDFLDQRAVKYELVTHPHTGSSAVTAEVSHVPGERLAKAVVLEHDGGYLMAVVPSNRRVSLGGLHRSLERQVGLATESELEGLFPDCEVGAIPPVGMAYGMETVVDQDLAGEPEIWFEAGDHEALVHMAGRDFQRLVEGASRAHLHA